LEDRHDDSDVAGSRASSDTVVARVSDSDVTVVGCSTTTMRSSLLSGEDPAGDDGAAPFAFFAKLPSSSSFAGAAVCLLGGISNT
jgi:hypothetical protein